MVGQWTEKEVCQPYPYVDAPGNPYTFMEACGWSSKGRWADAMLNYALVMEIDRTPAEGSIFAIGGSPSYDLALRHMPQFGKMGLWLAFLAWLYANLYSEGRGPGQIALEDLPALLDLSDAASVSESNKEARMH